MYAVIQSGGKQYRVTEGQTLKLETIVAEPGETVTFDKVLMLVDGDNFKIGTPFLKQAINATVISHGRHKKIKIIKFRRRKHYMKRMGHRQDFTEVKFNKIETRG